MKRSLLVSLLVTIAVSAIAFGASLGAGWHPKLGLDLAGGSEVVYQPAHKISSDQMNTTVNIMRNRVDAAGASGANVNSQGGQVVVQLPGVKNPEALIKLIGTTAQMQFRPVLCFAEPYSKPKSPPPSSNIPQACSAAQYDQTASNLNVNTTSGQPGNNVGADPALTSYKSSTFTYNDDHAGSYVLVPASPQSGQAGLRYLLGPTGVAGSQVASAQAVFQTPSWVVQLNFKSAGPWDTLAQEQFHAYIAVDLDGQVISAPLTLPNQSTFTSFGGKVQISGNFTQSTAQNLALDLNSGAIPVPLKQIDQTTVSPSLGKSSLKAGLAAGIGGLLLVLIYAIFYYRALGIVVISGLVTTAALLWAIVSALGHTSMNLTLDLAGVTGVIVSIGITVDSYIVYFERLKDEVRSGRSVRTSVDRGFRGAFRTVLAADLVSLAAAVVLYLLTVSTVRGFAFFLGLATLLDIFTTFFFTRPLVILLGRNERITRARMIGVARGLAVEPGAGT
ncbi:MAG TPA: protein translocase subunit SecD [Acidimicrobiales bacterium]|nr:protein translocase subunit SecD [Acidimicrobiales bacterium]